MTFSSNTTVHGKTDTEHAMCLQTWSNTEIIRCFPIWAEPFVPSGQYPVNALSKRSKQPLFHLCYCPFFLKEKFLNCRKKWKNSNLRVFGFHSARIDQSQSIAQYYLFSTDQRKFKSTQTFIVNH